MKLIFDRGIYEKYKDYDSKSKCYRYWYNMLRRCYDFSYILKNKTYLDCYVCKEWFYFQNFAKWYSENYYEIENCKMELDKDMRYKGNKLYSPSTSYFIPNFINAMFIRQEHSRYDENGKEIKETPIGVYKDKRSGKYYASLKARGINYKSKLYTNPMSAFEWYKNMKETYLKETAEYYKDVLPIEVYNLIRYYKVEIDD